jgi:hypothetical protein
VKFSYAFPFVVAAALLQCPASAQTAGGTADVIGKTILGGKRVELLSDRTWRFASTAETDSKCLPINTVLGFCGSILDWRPASTTGTEFTRIFQHDSRNYAGIVYENIGRADGMEREDYRALIISSAADAVGVPTSEVPVIDVFDQPVDEVPGETMIYGLRVKGLNVVYVNTAVLMDHHAVQFLTWSIGSELTDDHRALHDRFIAANRITVEDSDS